MARSQRRSLGATRADQRPGDLSLELQNNSPHLAEAAALADRRLFALHGNLGRDQGKVSPQCASDSGAGRHAGKVGQHSFSPGTSARNESSRCTRCPE